MAARNKLAVADSPDAITDALLTASRLLMAISARSIARVDETITIPQFRTLVILSVRGGQPEEARTWRLREDRAAFDEEVVLEVVTTDRPQRLRA